MKIKKSDRVLPRKRSWLAIAAGLMISLGSMAQPTNQAYDQWTFGTSVNTDVTNNFNANSNIATTEGCASYCDNNGNLLFYTDGVNIWNVNFPGTPLIGVMNGSPIGSAAQGVLILPVFPVAANPGLYYIFTVSDNGSTNNGLSVYLYDAINNTVGQQFPFTENSYTTEAITAIPDCNNPEDYWVIVKPIINPNPGVITAGLIPTNPASAINNALYAYHVVQGVISPTPVVSNFPLGAFSPPLNASLCWASVMKASPDRQFLALMERTGNWTGKLNFYQFDCGSGTFRFVCNQATPSGIMPYGLSFSPNSKYLYAGDGPNSIVQYDVSSVTAQMNCGGGVAALPVVSNFATNTGGSVYALQLTEVNIPIGNEQILIANNGSNLLDALSNPDVVGGGFNGLSYFLNTGTSRVGLPNNIDAQPVSPAPPLQISVCHSAKCDNTFCFSVEGCADYLIWNFGDATTINGEGYFPVTGFPNTSGTFRNPCHTYSVPGNHYVTVSNGTQTVGMNIVVPMGWNVSTNSTSSNDRGNDIVTDAGGNVYVCGTFETSTTFPALCGGITITGAGSPKSAYVAKFDPCGDLLWVNYEDGAGYSQATGIALDEVRGLVYICGEGSPGALIRFQSTARSCSVPAVPGANFAVFNYYVAKFNMNNGGYVDEYSGALLPSQSGAMRPNVFLDVVNRNLPTSNTDIYVTGTYFNGSSDVIYLDKVVDLAGYSSPWRKLGTAGKTNVQDIGYHDANHYIFITGEFGSGLTFNATTLNTMSLNEAFIWCFNESNGSNVPSGIKQLGITGGLNQAAGTSVKADPSGIYFTGIFDNTVNNAFGSGTNLLGGPPSGSKRTYVMKLNAVTNAVTWINQIYAGTGNAMASGIGLAGPATQVIVTGRFDNSLAFPAAFVANGTYIGSGNKMFLGSYDLSGTPLWSNATSDATAGSVHTSSRVAGTAQYTFATGKYINEMRYVNSAPPFTGPNMLATPAGSMNTYIVRNDITLGGIFRETQESSETATTTPITKAKGALLVYPNPSDGQLYIDLSEISNYTSVEVYDLMGRMIRHFENDGKDLKSVDLSGEQNGIYLVKVIGADHMITQKLIIQK